MAKQLKTWIDEDVGPFKDKPLSWLSAEHFFRDPVRPSFSNPDYFFSPADGVVLYQEEVGPSDSIVDIKGKPYSLREALREPNFDRPSLVIGIFMTFFDVHINRVPYPGRLSYRQLDPIDTLNHPMLEVEENILEDLRVAPSRAEYLRHNQRMVNRIETPGSEGPYYVLQIADYDVDSITPFELKQNQPCLQGQRFSQIRYGSQVDLIIPLSEHRELVPTQPVHCHVEAGIDTLVAIRPPKPTAHTAN
ncbi:MAG: Phosphatidylserine decarboxylase [uncultured Solirubrobacterales bacterium]|uniref:Phosphatidylserine decarboxylase n=1 Tax=uncultured Solirubrobacterales bacterium TaxID=768556 RepID=A0A6J4RUA0_9ACTN|nr:MAG: Phosphatidylserine decarboxylase [uncultured Solirubrobacterales bacterium]